MLKPDPAVKKCSKRASLLDRGLAKYKRGLIKMKKDNINSKMQMRNGKAAKLKEALLLRSFGLISEPRNSFVDSTVAVYNKSSFLVTYTKSSPTSKLIRKRPLARLKL